MNNVFDSSVIIKGLIKPKRRKQDPILKEQNRIYKLASSFIDKAYNQEINLIIPTAAVIETAAVSARLSGDKSVGNQTATFITNLATQIISEKEILQDCIDIASTTMISGFDSVFITCAKLTNSALITDDKKMYDAAVKLGIKVKLLRNM